MAHGLLALSVVVSSLLFVAVLHAEEADVAVEKSVADEARSARGSAEQPGIEEIVITGRKKVERVQDAPIAVTALTGPKLEAAQITNLSEVANLAPNLIFDGSAPLTASSSASSIYIRGIGSSEFAPSADPGVGIFVDGVFLARSIGGVLDLVAPERIEVLRGPQGTIFGRNTIGGAINIITTPPETEFKASAKVAVGSDDFSSFSGSVNVPLAETVATRFALVRKRRDGFVHNRAETFADTGGEDSLSGSGTIRWLASDSVSVTLRGDFTRERATNAGGVLVDFSTLDPSTGGPSFVGAVNQLGMVTGACVDASDTSNPGCFNAQFLAGAFATAGGFNTNTDLLLTAASKPLNPETELDVRGGSVTLEWEATDQLTVRSITAHRRIDSFFSEDIDHSPIVLIGDVHDFDQKQTSQELQLLGNALDKRLDWNAGLFYFQEDADQKDIVEIPFGLPVFTPNAPPSFPSGVFSSGGKFDNLATAAFGQANFSLTEKLKLTAGARYSYEKKVFDVTRAQVLATIALQTPDGSTVVLPQGLRLIQGEDKATNRERQLSTLLSLSYFWTPEVMTYASFSEGFKGGGFEQRVFPPRALTPKFDKETARVYELGLKSTFFDSRLLVNAAAFFTSYDDLQLQVFEGLAPVTRNAAEAQIRGFEVETVLRPVQSFLFEASLGSLDADYTDVDLATVGIDRDNEFVNAPDWTASAAVTHYIYLPAAWGSAAARVGWTYRDDTFNDAFNTPALRQNQTNIYDASLIWDSPDGAWQVAVSGKNLTDRKFIVSGLSSLMVGVTEATFDRGRRFTIAVERSF
jgi:iron complex outermembrane receptor protein